MNRENLNLFCKSQMLTLDKSHETSGFDRNGFKSVETEG